MSIGEEIIKQIQEYIPAHFKPKYRRLWVYEIIDGHKVGRNDPPFDLVEDDEYVYVVSKNKHFAIHKYRKSNGANIASCESTEEVRKFLKENKNR